MLVQTPDVDRCKIDHPQIAAIVLNKDNDSGMFQLGTQHGKLDHYMRYFNFTLLLRNSCYHWKFPIMWLELGKLQNFTVSMVVRVFSDVFAIQNV